MSWGPEPSDLDFHDRMYNQQGEIVCEVYYGNKECDTVNLDIDNISVRGYSKWLDHTLLLNSCHNVPGRRQWTRNYHLELP